MNEPYEPQVNDYVIWDRGEHGKDEGWVYFKCPPLEDRGIGSQEEYITIETGVRPKPKCQYTKNERHKFIHTLLLCHRRQWGELKFVKRRTPEQQIQHYSQCED